MILLEPDYELEEFRPHSLLAVRPQGMMTTMPSWGGSEHGWVGWPKGYVANERGIVDQPVSPTHFHDGRPMAW